MSQSSIEFNELYLLLRKTGLEPRKAAEIAAVLGKDRKREAKSINELANKICSNPNLPITDNDINRRALEVVLLNLIATGIYNYIEVIMSFLSMYTMSVSAEVPDELCPDNPNSNYHVFKSSTHGLSEDAIDSVLSTDLVNCFSLCSRVVEKKITEASMTEELSLHAGLAAYILQSSGPRHFHEYINSEHV